MPQESKLGNYQITRDYCAKPARFPSAKNSRRLFSSHPVAWRYCAGPWRGKRQGEKRNEEKKGGRRGDAAAGGKKNEREVRRSGWGRVAINTSAGGAVYFKQIKCGRNCVTAATPWSLSLSSLANQPIPFRDMTPVINKAGCSRKGGAASEDERLHQGGICRDASLWVLKRLRGYFCRASTHRASPTSFSLRPNPLLLLTLCATLPGNLLVFWDGIVVRSYSVNPNARTDRVYHFFLLLHRCYIRSCINVN